MARIDFGGVEEEIVTAEEFTLEKARKVLPEAVAALPSEIRERYLDRSGYFADSTGSEARRRLGDYIHLRSDTLGAELVFAATYNGEQDIFAVRIGPRDCNRNGVPDTDDLRAGLRDCDHDGILDSCEIAAGAETDSDDDDIPDRCQPAPRRPTGRVIPGVPIPAAPHLSSVP